VPRRKGLHIVARFASICAIAAAALSLTRTAGATEGETDVAITGGVTFLDARGKGIHIGAGGTVMARHGLTDAFDAAFELSLSLQPTLGSTLYGAAAGAHYVVDVGIFRPHVGLLAGVTDVSTTTCDPRPSNLPEVTEPRPPLFACRDDFLFTGVVPIGVDWAPSAPFRIGFASRTAVMPFRPGVPDLLFHVTLGAGLTWVFDADEASR
jgi:hypothetical protein